MTGTPPPGAQIDGPPAPLVVEDLSVVYQRGAVPAVDGVTFTLGPGDGLLVAGGRGSGKSTVLRAVLGLVPIGGRVRVFGTVPGDPTAMRRVGYGPQGRAFAAGMTPRRLVALVATLRGLADPSGDAVDAALGAAGLVAGADRRGDDVERLRRVALACALVGEPDLLVLDDPWEFPETIAAIRATRERGGAVLAASYDPGGLPDLLGRTLTIDAGVPA